MACSHGFMLFILLLHDNLITHPRNFLSDIKLVENFGRKKIELEVRLDKILELRREIVKLKVGNEDSNNQG